MYLFRKKIKGKSINHPLGNLPNLPKNVDPNYLNTLLDQLKSGNKYVIDEILRSHIRLAINIASQYAILMPYKTNDLVSEAMLTIINCCQNPSEIENLSAYLISKIHSALARFIDEDNIIKIPTSTLYRKKLKNLTRVSIQDYTKATRLQDIREMIDAAIKTEQERLIINLRAQSYVDKEISEIIGLSVSRIGQIRQEVYERYEKLEKQ